MTATEIGIYTRQAGVWERCNAGTPEGFSGPQVRQGGTWQNIVVGYAKASAVWKECWVNIDGEIELSNVFTLFASDTSGPSYQCTCQWYFDSDGSFLYRAYNNNNPPPTYTEVSGEWRKFDNGRTYQIWYDITDQSGPATWSTSPSLAETTWDDLDTDQLLQFQDTYFDTNPFFSRISSVSFTVRIREKVSAPSGGNDTATMGGNINMGLLI